MISPAAFLKVVRRAEVALATQFFPSDGAFLCFLESPPLLSENHKRVNSVLELEKDRLGIWPTS